MPLYLECPRCAREFKTIPENAGKTVQCPGCRGPVKAVAPDVAPLSLDDPPEAGGEFDFEQADRPRSREIEDDRDDDRVAERPRTSTSARKRGKNWDDIISGLSAIQIGLIILAIAETVFVIGPQVIRFEKMADGFTKLINMFILCFMIGIGATACFCFGHTSASSASDPKANKLATWSFITSMVSVVLWMAFLGIFIYLRARLEHFMRKPDEMVWLLRGLGISFTLAIVTMWTAELLFLGVLMRAGWLLANNSLFNWSKALFIALSVLLGTFVVFVIYHVIQVNRNVQLGGIANMGRSELKVLYYSFYGLTVVFLACYWYGLFIARRVLIHAKSRGVEDLDDDRRERSRSRDSDDY